MEWGGAAPDGRSFTSGARRSDAGSRWDSGCPPGVEGHGDGRSHDSLTLLELTARSHVLS